MQKKVLIIILAYNAKTHIAKILRHIPESLWNNPEYKAEIVIIDDCAHDKDCKDCLDVHVSLSDLNKPIFFLLSPVHLGYGGNQKMGYTYAIEHGYDIVVMTHSDGRHPPEFLPEMIAPILKGEADGVFGSHTIKKHEAIQGGMPLYKFVRNFIITKLQNLVLGSKLTEFQSGYRAYSVDALKRLPFQHNSNTFDFDMDIIIQFVNNKLVLKEISIPNYSGDDIRRINGIRYAFKVIRSSIISRTQKYGIFYNPKFDYEHKLFYADKTGFASSHHFAVSHVEDRQRVLDIGGGEGYVSEILRKRGCLVTGCDWRVDDTMRAHYDAVYAMNLNHPDFTLLSSQHFDVIMLLDVIEHLLSPEEFMKQLHQWSVKGTTHILLTTPNIAFFVQRFMLLLGQFNYGKRGTLDMTHTRLFTFTSLKRLLTSTGYDIIEMQGIPAPVLSNAK
ncbi:MAG: bifunctional glycosyltransferase/class I SAM-dependent methyltransferase [Legionella sp.]|jgi:glycosyltransferase involved in cell wall biosynthesis